MELQGYPDANNGLRIALPDRGPAVQCDSQGIKFTAIGSGPNTRNEPEKWTSCAVVHRVDRISTMSVQRFQGRDADVFGHHFLVCLQDTSLTAEEREYLAALKPLGILLHPGNLPNTDSPESITASVAELLQQIRSATQREELLIAMTHEATSALPSPLPSWPTCDRYARAAGDVGRAIGKELRSLGVNLCLGPACNILWSHDPAVIPALSFGELIEEVTRDAAVFAAGIQESGIRCAPSAFPGDGGVARRPGTPTPRLDETVDAIMMRDVQPFLTQIELGASAIVISTALFAAIDRDYPASLSALTIQKLLRTKLRFSGVAICGDLANHDVRAGILDAEIAARALSATGDLFIVSDISYAYSLATHMLDAAGLELVSSDMLNASFARIEALMGQLPNSSPEAFSRTELQEHAALLQRISGER